METHMEVIHEGVCRRGRLGRLSWSRYAACVCCCMLMMCVYYLDDLIIPTPRTLTAATASHDASRDASRDDAVDWDITRPPPLADDPTESTEDDSLSLGPAHICAKVKALEFPYELPPFPALSLPTSRYLAQGRMRRGGENGRGVVRELWASSSPAPPPPSLPPGVRQRLPGVLIIGAKKSGTTYLSQLLSRHPGLSVPTHEIHYFNCFAQPLNATEYRRRLPYSLPHQLTVDKTPRYWTTGWAPAHARRLLPHAKLLLLVRDPACRLISDYFFSQKTLGFMESLHEAINDSALYSQLLAPSLYDVHMRRWLRHYPRHQMMVVRTEDLPTPRLSRVLTELQHFLGLSQHLQVRISQKRNFICVGGTPEDILCSRLARNDSCKCEDLYADVMEHLRTVLRPHVTRFQKLLNRTFKWPGF